LASEENSLNPQPAQTKVPRRFSLLRGLQQQTAFDDEWLKLINTEVLFSMCLMLAHPKGNDIMQVHHGCRAGQSSIVTGVRVPTACFCDSSTWPSRD
jgi:hypothetical protein